MSLVVYKVMQLEHIHVSYRYRVVEIITRTTIPQSELSASIMSCFLERMGTDSLGAAADQAVYRGQNYREFREVLARDKDLAKWIVKPDPTFLGDTIPISGTGIESH